MKKIAAIFVAVSILALTALAYGDMGSHGMRTGMMFDCGMDGQMPDTEHHMSKYLRNLNLDEQQKSLIGEIKTRMMKETIRRVADIRIVQIEIKDLLRQEQLDMKAIESKLKQMEMMKTEMHLSHIRAMEECKSKLTHEQRKKLGEMMEYMPMMEGMPSGSVK